VIESSRFILKLDRKTKLAPAVDVMMARAKAIYILMIKINFVGFSLRCFLKEKGYMFYRVIETLVEVWEKLGELEEACDLRLVFPQQFSFS